MNNLPGKSTPADVAERRRRAWELRTERGYSQTQIAEELGCSQATIHRDLKHIGAVIVANLAQEASQEKAVQLAILRHAAFDSLRAWEASKKPHTQVVERKKRMPVDSGMKDAHGKPIHVLDEDGRPALIDVEVNTTQTVTTRIGNPTYLALTLKALADIRDLLGIEPPKVIDINWRQELEAAGVDPADAWENLVQQFYSQIQENDTEKPPILPPGE